MIETGYLQPHTRLPGTRLGGWHVFEAKGIYSGGVVEKPGAHSASVGGSSD